MGCQWADGPLGRKAKGADARRAIADRSCFGGIDDVGAHPRDIVVPRRRHRGGIPDGRTDRPAVGCQWADGTLGWKAKLAVARRAIADRSCFSGNDNVGAHPRDIVVPRRRRRGGIPDGQTDRPAVGCQWADGTLGWKAEGVDTGRAVTNRTCGGAVDVIGTRPRDVGVPRRVAPAGRGAEGGD
ncbi:MAG: hypothetical protein NTW96_27230 [Planctomycetia bacterium]|nr:hypothetical protein [Planctomycetia bacterium]